MVSSVINEGSRGMLNSQREMQRAASEVARANVRSESVVQESDIDRASTLAPVESAAKTEQQRGIAEPLIELRRQEQVFNASAQVVSTADQTLGSLLDVKA